MEPVEITGKVIELAERINDTDMALLRDVQQQQIALQAQQALVSRHLTRAYKLEGQDMVDEAGAIRRGPKPEG